MKDYLRISFKFILVSFSLFLFSSGWTLRGQQCNERIIEKEVKYRNEIFNGLSETEILFSPVPINQGITTDGEYYYVSPDHNTIEKRSFIDFNLIVSATHTNKIGGLFYDSVKDEILTCSGQYTTGGNAYITRINKSTLAEIASIDISKHTVHGVNAIVKVDNKIYVGETAVNYDAEPKSWYSFDSEFNFINSVFSHSSKTGMYDWQDATVYDGKIYATDHGGFIYAFSVFPNGALHQLGVYNSSGKYYEGITSANDLFIIWKSEVGIVSAKLK